MTHRHYYPHRRRKYLVYRTEVERFKNPFSRRSQQKSRTFRVYTILLGLAILGLAYFLFYSSVFRINSVDVVGNVTIRSEDIANIANELLGQRKYLLFPENNYFVFDKDLLKQKINEKFVLDRIDVKKKFTHGLVITIEEKIPVVSWVTNDKYYFLDIKGIAIKESSYNFFDSEGKAIIKKGEAEINLEQNPKEIGGGLPLVYDENNLDVKLGERILDPEIIGFILNLFSTLPKEGIEVASFSVAEEKNRTLKVKTAEGWLIYFNYVADFNTQINNLRTVLSGKIKDSRSSLQYIDLRFGSKVYFK